MHAGEGNALLLLDVTVRNIDTEGRRFLEGHVVGNHEGRPLLFDHTETVFGEGFLVLVQLNPLTSVRGTIVYKIPAALVGEAYWVPGRDDKRIAFQLTPPDPRQPATGSTPFSTGSAAAQTVDVDYSEHLITPAHARSVECYKDELFMEEVALVGVLKPGHRFALVVTSGHRGPVRIREPAPPLDSLATQSARAMVRGTIVTSCAAADAKDVRLSCWEFDTSRPMIVRLLRDGEMPTETSKSVAVPREASATLQAKMDARYAVTDESVTDQRTGLTWKRCLQGMTWDGAECQPSGEPWNSGEADRLAAEEAAKTGLGWRLPTRDELLTLVSTTRKCPALDVAAFGANAHHFVMTRQPKDAVCCQSWQGVDFNTGKPGQLFADAAGIRLVRASTPP